MSRTKPLIYVAGPFRKPDPIINAAAAVDFANNLRDDLGVSVIIPHLSLFEHFQRPRPDQYWLDVTLELLRCCDAMYRIPGFSTGSDAEEAEAITAGIPVFHSTPALAEWVANWREAYDRSQTRPHL